MIDLVDAPTMGALDRRTIDELGLPGAVLMENAGRGVVRAIFERFGHAPRSVAIVAGRGNNGGDGHVVARLLAARGWTVHLGLVGRREQVSGDAALHLGAHLAAGGALTELSDAAALAAWAREAAPELVVDALLGTGLADAVRGTSAAVLEWMSTLHCPVVAVDVPSGVNASDGRLHGPAPRATLTVTFGAGKLGHVLPPGSEHCGQVRVVDIGIPVARWREDASDRVRWMGAEVVGPWLAPRDAQDHKGRFGHVLIVAGSTGKTGAAALAARGAQRWGAGLVTVATPASLLGEVGALCVEAMAAPLSDAGSGCLQAGCAGEILRLAEGKDAVVLGPGLGTDPGTRAAVLDSLAELDLPTIVDADGLNAIGTELARAGAARAPRVLTPHPGEMARLVGLGSAEVQADRLGVARDVAARSGAVVVLKGAGTIVARPGGAAAVCSTGNPGMASGGMGDVLSGAIGAALASGGGASAADAAEAAVWLHGRAGDRLAGAGRPGVLAWEVADELPRALAEIADGATPASRLEWLDGP